MNIQKTALYEYHKSLGAKFVSFAGYQMPVQYTSGIVEDNLSLLDNVVVQFERTGFVRLEGEKAFFLHR